jgi:hypothetical protein
LRCTTAAGIPARSRVNAGSQLEKSLILRGLSSIVQSQFLQDRFFFLCQRTCLPDGDTPFIGIVLNSRDSKRDSLSCRASSAPRGGAIQSQIVWLHFGDAILFLHLKFPLKNSAKFCVRNFLCKKLAMRKLLILLGRGLHQDPSRDSLSLN